MGEKYLSGFVSLIGSPNAGKLTLMNAFVGQKVSIVSERAQTTRNRILGVMTRRTYQIVFIDTPGVTMPKNKLGEYMLKVAYESLNEVEAILFMIDAAIGIGEKDEALIEKLRGAKSPVIAVINKTDVAKPKRVEEIEKRLAGEKFIKDTVRVSALTHDGLDALEKKLVSYLEEGPQYFPDDMVTDMPERVICGELLREKALRLLRQEIPHGIGVDIEKMELRTDGIYDVWASIYCERDSHKGIIIGKNGSMLKKIASQARTDMEWLLGIKVNLQVWVKVKEDWRNRTSVMKELGYE